ncbi:3'-5' exoribonuclease domain-containing protein [Paenarthrobacter nicotinovorans]|uniref:3'-5' exoribonuclease domain-containing protein n=1 Tax=Paenarthrobacter nicotinovorans TaxID=29320 RepID=UPI0037F8EBD3
MKYFYDTEFLEDGDTIKLISIGIVAEDGREYYATSSDMPVERIRKHEWLMENVFPHLPFSGDWKPRTKIRDEVAAFLTHTDKTELWGYYSAYDHVLLAQLFGTMMDLPEGIPMYTNDVRSLVDFTGITKLPRQKGVEHDALADARHVKVMHDYLKAQA